MCIFDLMKVPTEELKELTIEEFVEEIRTKRVNIYPFTDKRYFYVHGDIYIDAIHVHLYLGKHEDGYTMNIWGETNDYSSLNVYLSERIIFGIYSYGNGKNYRIAFEGNSPDLLISAWNRDKDKKQIIQDDIRALIRRYEREKEYEPNNIEIITKTVEELKKLLD